MYINVAVECTVLNEALCDPSKVHKHNGKGDEMNLRAKEYLLLSAGHGTAVAPITPRNTGYLYITCMRLCLSLFHQGWLRAPKAPLTPEGVIESKRIKCDTNYSLV